MSASVRRAALSSFSAVAFLVVGMVGVEASALPPSLRSDSDVVDAVDTVMRSVAAGRIAAGVRALGAYTSISALDLAARTVRIEKEHDERRKRLGLGIGAEAIASVRVGERLWRVTQLQHFDKGYVAWHFTFHRPAQAWQLVELEVIENDRRVFGAEPGPSPAPDTSAAAAGETPTPSPGP